MKDQIVYVELKTGFDHNGPAWIGRFARSKSGRTIYFNGRALRMSTGPGVQGNYFDVETGEEYWISGVKKNQADRHLSGFGIVMIDESVIEEYLALTGSKKLDSKKFKIVQLDHGDVADRIHEIENNRTHR